MMSRVRLSVKIGLSLAAIGWMILPGSVVAKSLDDRTGIVSTDNRSPTLDRAEVTPTLLAQTTTTQITGVKLTPTDKGIEISIETAAGTIATPKTLTQGNISYTDIPNAVLALPDGKELRVENPVVGIANISVTQVSPTFVRVLITGTDGSPTAQVATTDRGLTISSTPAQPTAQAGNEPEIEINVIGLRNQRGYKLPNATTATKTDTPIKDIPQSIQIVPPEVLRDRNVRTLTEAVETVSGVLDSSNNYGAPGGAITIRGFNSFDSGNLRNGFRDYDYYSVSSIGTIEQVEVLKGPSSVLFGTQEPGGVINTVTKKPLNTPYANATFQVGNYGFYQPSVDFSGPLTTDRNVLYRFIASYRGAGSYQDFVGSNITTIAPSVTVKLGERTDLSIAYEYTKYFADNPSFEVPLLSNGRLPPRNFFNGYPNLVLSDITTNRISYSLNHKFSDNWQVRNNLAIVANQRILNRNFFETLVNESLLTNGTAQESNSQANNYFGQIDLIGKFNTGSISHQTVVGLDVNYLDSRYREIGGVAPDLNIFSPNYNISRPEYSPGFASDEAVKSYGIYVQDQIAFSDKLKLLIGGRYDWVSSDLKILSNDTDEPVRNDGAFSPRIGLVYQPSDNISLYASYSNSFKPSSGFSINPDGEVFKPTRGTQYEVGVKTDLLDRKLSATLAAYNITKNNVITPDPNNPGFSIQTGEVRSQGIELDVVGEILPGWKVIGSYAYTDPRVTKDNATPVGNQLDNAPSNQASLWTTYEIQKGNLRGLGFGLGLFYIGQRQGDLANSFQLPSHLRTDAALYYRQDGFKAAINIRNLFDIDYGSYSFGRNIIQRGEPLTIAASVGWDF